MFDVYIKNYKTRSGTYATDENLLYSIPMDHDEENALGEPKCSVGMGKAGNFEFTMQVGHPYYESLLQMKTIFRIVYDGDTIFRGRVVTIDVGHMTGNKKVHCEGDYCFLLDTQIDGVEDAKRSKTNALVYMQALIAQHNAQVANDMLDKQFTLGEVPGQYTNAITTPQRVKPDSDYRYGSSSWKDSQAAFNELSDSFGGFWRTRYQNGTVYLDWLDSYYDPAINDQTIELAENLLEITSSSEVNNIFTALIPIGSANGKNIYLDDYRTDIHGANKYILVPQILNVFSDEELNSGFHSKQDYQKAIEQYGWIYKAESFSNASTKAKLWEYATDFIKNNYCGGLSKFSISAVDMHAIGEQVGKFLIGGRVNVIYPDVDKRDTDPEAMIHKTLTVMEATYELHNPEKNQYVIGIPNAILKKNYGEKSRKSKGSGAGPKKDQEEKNEIFDNWKKYTNSMVWTFVQDEFHNSEDFHKYKETYGEKAADAVVQAAFITVGNKLNEVPGATADIARLLSRKAEINGHDGVINVYGPVNPQAVQKAKETGELHTSITIGSLERAGITIDPLLPEVAKNWKLEQFNAIKGKFAAKIEPTSDGAKLTMTKTTGQTASSAGTNFVTAAIDSIKGSYAGVKVDLSQSLNGVQDVIDENAMPGLDLNGTLTKITGNKGNLNMFGLSGTSGFGEFDFKKTIEDATTGDLSSVTTLLGSGTDGSVKGGDGDANKGWTFSISGAEQRGDFGKDDSGNWLVRVNDKVTYSDEQGTEHTLEPGFVTANDFKIASIPSFKTKFAVIGTLVTGKVNAVDLQAERAYIAKISGNTIDSSSWVRAGSVYANFISATGSTGVSGSGLVSGSRVYGSSGIYTPNYYIGSTDDYEGPIKTASVYLMGVPGASSPTGIANVSAAYIGAATSVDLRHNHKITIGEETSGSHEGEMKVTIGEAIVGTATTNIGYFRIAATQTYRQGVAAAEAAGEQRGLATGYTNGWGACFGDIAMPTTTSVEKSDFTFVTPSAQVDGEPDTNTYTLSVDDDYAYIKKSGSTYAKVPNTKAGGSTYTEYMSRRQWSTYTPGTSYSTRKMTIWARGKRASDGEWEDIAGTRTTFTVTGSYQATETGSGHELIISSY